MIEHGIEVPADVFGKEAQDQVALLLHSLILPAIATVRRRIGKVLRTIEFDSHSRVEAEQVHLQGSVALPALVEGASRRLHPEIVVAVWRAPLKFTSGKFP